MTFARKVFLQLPIPSPADLLADRERVLEAFHADSMTLSTMQKLYPTLKKANYAVTASLSPTNTGWEIRNIEAGDTRSRSFALALDLGSTTLEMELLDLNTGETLASGKATNGQTAISANILDRILYAKDRPDHLAHLQALVTENINNLIVRCCTQAQVDPSEILLLAVGGNTTMIHLLLACEPWQVFQIPYTPVFYDPGIQEARDIGLNLSCSVFCMPAVANYLGGDITSGLLMTDLDTRTDPALFLDIGTNGEIAFGCKDFLLVGAGAAGPALEGAVSKSGMRAEPGAVCNVTIDERDQIHVKTIGDKPPMGICGSGILDLIAHGFLAGWINGNGTLNVDAAPAIRWTYEPDTQRQLPAICYAQGPEGPLLFTQADIQEFIRCKAAAFTMAATLMEECGVTPADLGAMYLAGGFGEHMDLESAITVGMYPDIPREKFKILGNSSLKGVKKLLLDEAQLPRLRKFAQDAQYVQFGEMARFPENMVAAQFLPHTDTRLFPSVQPGKRR